MTAPAARADGDGITVVVADDHAVVRIGLRLLIEAEPGLRVLAGAATGPDAIRTARAHHPDVVILDFGMPGGSSLAGIPALAAAGIAVVVLTRQDDAVFARAALRAGAKGFVLKENADDELLTALRVAAAGDTHVGARFKARLEPS